MADSEAVEQWYLEYNGEREFVGSRTEVSTYALNHGLSRYYRGKRHLNLGVVVGRVNKEKKT